MKEYVLVTHWHLDAPIGRVWEALVRVAEWPRWWKYVHAVEDLEAGGAEGAGSLRRYTWSSRLPYRLSLAWMNLLAPLLAPAFRWNHGQVMAEGGRGIARHLGVKLLDMDAV